MQVAAFVISGWIAYYVGAFVVLSGAPPSHILGQTMAFIVIGWTSIWHIFTVRSRRSIFRRPIMDNPVLVYSALAMTILFALLVIIPPAAEVFGKTQIGFNHWLVAIALAIFPTITAEVHKLTQKTH